MFDYLSALLLGIIEGVTEFLPISSTGHLILANQWIGFGAGNESFSKMFDVVIQLGAIIAVIVFFFKRLWPFGAHKPLDRKIQVWVLWFKAVVGVLPALILGALFGEFIHKYLFTPAVVGTALLVWGIVIVYLERVDRKPRIAVVEKLSYMDALLIGLIQCLAMIPGTSRSAATIVGAMMLGSSRVVAAEFSFFLAIPTMVAATGYSLMKDGASMNAHQIVLLTIGFVTSFLVALVVIKAFMKFISNRDFIPFGIYRVALGALVLVYFFLIK